MYRKIKNILFIVTVMLMSSLTWGHSLTEASPQQPSTYSIKPVLPDSQVKDVNSYFKMFSETDFEDTLAVEITNPSNEPLVLEVTSLNAYTSHDGTIQYTDSNGGDEYIITNEEQAFKNYVNILDIVKVEPNSISTFSFDVKIPKLDGSVLGAISFKTTSEGEETADESISLQINNEINNVIALHVDFGNNKFENVEFGQPFLNYSEHDTYIKIPIITQSNSLTEGARLQYQIYDADEEIVFENKEGRQVHIVGDAGFEYHIPWESNRLDVDRDYRIKGKLIVETQEGKKSFDFDKKFKYVKQESNSVDAGMLGGVQLNGSNSYTLIVIALLIALVAVSYVVYKRNKRNKASLTEDERYCEEGAESSLQNDEDIEVENSLEYDKIRFILNAKELLDSDYKPLADYRFDNAVEEILNNETRFKACFVNNVDGDTPLDLPFTVEEKENVLCTLEGINEMYYGDEYVGIYYENGLGQYNLQYVVVPFE